MTYVDVREGWPDLPATAEQWLDELRGPTAIGVPGRDHSRIRVVSGLLHGNEPSGLRAIFALLRRRQSFATDVLFFLGAVEAARHVQRFTHRLIPGRRDLNRCFRAPFDGTDGKIAEEALACMRSERLEALVDLHNNTGHNPVYAVGVAADPERLGLSSYFSGRYVSSSFSMGALHEAFAGRTPAIVVECGRAGDPSADALAIEGLSSFLASDRLRTGRADDFRVLVDPVRVRLRRGATLRFGDTKGDADLTLTADIDRHNFGEIDRGQRVGWVRPGAPLPVEARTEKGEDVTEQLFETRGDDLMTSAPIVPIMMTTNVAVAISDCLFYVVRDLGTEPIRTTSGSR